MNDDQHIEPERLSLSVVRSLRWIILLSVAGIIGISLLGISLAYGLIGDPGIEPSGPSAVDEAVSVIGNIASACVGGLVGFLTRDLVLKIEDSRKIRQDADRITMELDEEGK